jgi:putative ABC transport system permease protein
VRGTALSVRALARVPIFTTTIIVTVGIGVGGCTAIFAIADALFIRALPYADADRLSFIYTDSPPSMYPFSVADFLALDEQQTSFEHVAAYTARTRSLTRDDLVEAISARLVTPAYFTTLGVKPALGRTFVPADGVPGADPTVVVTAGFASRHLGRGNPLGASVRLDGTEHQVIGVLPPDPGPLGRSAEVYPILQLEPPPRKGPFFLSVVGRRKPGVRPEVAAEELATLNRRLFPVWADSYQDERASWGANPLAETLAGGVGSLLMVLLGAVGFVLLIATANAANLLLARVAGRRSELAVRAALGASRGQILARLLSESALLAAGGALVGLIVAQGVFTLLPVVASGYIPRLEEVGFSGSVLAFAALMTLASGVLFGAIPSLTGRVSDLSAALRQGGRAVSMGLRQQRYQRLLVMLQVAVAMPLLAGAGLLVASFSNLANADPGYETEELLTMQVALSVGAYPEQIDRVPFWDETLLNVAALPGVVSVGLATSRPPLDNDQTNNFDLEDAPTPPGESQPTAPWVGSEPGFFETLGIPLLSGRMFEPGDDLLEAPVVLVDKTWEDRFFPGESAVGRRLREGGCTTCEWTTVIGVVGNLQFQGPGISTSGTVYDAGSQYRSRGFLYVRTAGSAEGIMPQIREQLRAIDPTVPVTRVSTAEQLISASLTRPRHLMLLLGSFSSVALLLSMIGLYGTMAYAVQCRRSDIAIRIALGGAPKSVVHMVVGQGMVLVLVGLLAGVGASLGLTQVMSSLLYDVAPTDPLTLMTAAGLLAGVALVACLVPARQAARLDPTATLREE